MPSWPGDPLAVHAAWVWNRSLVREQLTVVGNPARGPAVSDLEFLGRVCEHALNCRLCLLPPVGVWQRRPIDELLAALRRVRRMRPIVDAALSEAS